MASQTPLRNRLRNKVTIQTPTETVDSYGDVTTTWATFAITWASIVPLNGTEFYQARQADSFVNVRIRIRHIDNITTKMRVLWGSRVYDIDSIINPMERDKEIILMCREDIA